LTKWQVDQNTCHLFSTLPNDRHRKPYVAKFSSVILNFKKW
jgi:hypothetical protein